VLSKSCINSTERRNIKMILAGPSAHAHEQFVVSHPPRPQQRLVIRRQDRDQLREGSCRSLVEIQRHSAAVFFPADAGLQDSRALCLNQAG